MEKRNGYRNDKLWRDLLIEKMEKMGSLVEWQSLDDEAYDYSLRQKLIEEAEEVALAQNREELVMELADLSEVIRALLALHSASSEEIETLRLTKYRERGGFEGRRFVSNVFHVEDSFGDHYCKASPDKYPPV